MDPAQLATPEALAELATRQFCRGTTIDGKFVVREMLGQGGMGLCLRVWEKEFERDCVLKMLGPHLDARYTPEHDAAGLLVREAKTLAQLASVDSHSFVQVFGRGSVHLAVEDRGGKTTLDLPYYVMELLRGSNFQKVISGYRRANAMMAWNVVLDIAHKAALALSIAHAQRPAIIHRDLKPDNLFLQDHEHRRAEVKIIDWGISVREGEPTRGGTGTRRYAAPEFLLERLRLTRESTQSDIYPLGLIIFELATLRGPFDGTPAESLGYAHVHLSPPLLSAIRGGAPPPLVQLVTAALEKAPENRPTAREMATGLASILDGLHEGRAADSQIAQLIKTVAQRGGQGPVSRPAAQGSSLPLQPEVPTAPASRILALRAPEGEPAAQPVATMPLPGHAKVAPKYADTDPDAEPFGAVAGGAPDGVPSGPVPAQPIRVFNSTAEMFEFVWDDDTRYSSSPLAEGLTSPDQPAPLEARSTRTVTEPLARAPAASTDPTPAPVTGPPPPSERRSIARRIAFGVAAVAAGLLLGFGVNRMQSRDGGALRAPPVLPEASATVGTRAVSPPVTPRVEVATISVPAAIDAGQPVALPSPRRPAPSAHPAPKPRMPGFDLAPRVPAPAPSEKPDAGGYDDLARELRTTE